MIHKCVFPAAGYGTRFLPITKSMPKEMLPIVNKPLIEYGVEEALEAGMSNVCIVTGRGKRAIEDHFDLNYELEHQIHGTTKESMLTNIRKIIEQCTFSYIRQKRMKGLGDAILTAKPLIGREPFGVVLADDLCLNPNGLGVMSQMLELYRKYQCSIVAVEPVPADKIHNYGIVSGVPIGKNLIRVNKMHEKPSRKEALGNLGIIGRYILTPDIFDIIAQTSSDKSGEIQITDALMAQASNGAVIAYQFEGTRFDCGFTDGFIKATNHCFAQLKNHADVCDGKKFMKINLVNTEYTV